jgi:hypothetical protein
MVVPNENLTPMMACHYPALHNVILLNAKKYQSFKGRRGVETKH